MNNLKSIIIIGLTFILVSCSTGIDRKYDKSTKEKDLKEISEKIPKPYFKILKQHIIKLENDNKNLSDKTYKTLLKEAEVIEYARLEKIEAEKKRVENEKQIEKEKIDTENLKLLKLKRIKFLCAKKWKIIEYGYQMEIQDDSEENIKQAKLALNKTIFTKKGKISFSVIKKSNKVFVVGMWNKKMTLFMNNNNKRFKKYSIDGTYKEQSGKTIYRGTWEFENVNNIREVRPAFEQYRKHETDIFKMGINTLDKKIFFYTETKYNPLETNPRVYTCIVMKSV